MKLVTKRFLALILALAMCFSLTACTSSKDRMMFGTGGTAGTYYAYGGVLAQYMKRYADVKVTAVSTGGSKVNIQSIQDGDFQLGFTQSDVMTYGWEGTRAFEKDGGTQDFRVMGCLYAETVQIFTLDKSIKSVADLKGKKVSIGAPGSGVYFNAMDVLEAAGITEDDFIPQYQSFEDSKEALKDHNIDAAFVVAGAPTSAITELDNTNGVYFVNIDGELRDKIIKEHPYYTATTLKPETYPTQKEPVETISVQATVIVSKDLSEEQVYKMTAALFDHVDEIKSENGKGAELNIENASSITNVPYHVGAAKYYKEHGITVNSQE